MPVKDKVREVFPLAHVERYKNPMGITTHYIVWSKAISSSGLRLGTGKTSAEAWKRAYDNLVTMKLNMVYADQSNQPGHDYMDALMRLQTQALKGNKS